MAFNAYDDFAALYDPLMKDVDYDAWAEYLLSFLKEKEGKNLSIAECACGTGEITLRLARAGHKITALDISQEMLSVAGEKARRAGMKIPFVQQDMRKLLLHKPVDAVIAACDGVNYLTSREHVEQFFRAAHAALKPGGLLLFDVSSRYKLQEILAGNTFGEDDGEYAYFWRNAYDEDNKLLEMQLTFFSREGKLYRRFTETHIQRAHSEMELIHALESAGFQEHETYCAFTREPPKRECERLQFVARKTNGTV